MPDPRQMALALVDSLPETVVEPSGDDGRQLGVSVRRKRFAWLLDDHHGDGRLSVTCKAAPGVNAELAEADPERWYLPPYMASRGWAAVWIDGPDVDWDHVEQMLVDAYRLVAPKKLLAELDVID